MSLDQPRNHPKNRGGFTGRARRDDDKPLGTGLSPVDLALAAVKSRWPKVASVVVAGVEGDRWTWPPGSKLRAAATVDEVLGWKEVRPPSGVFVMETLWERDGRGPVPAEVAGLNTALAGVRDLTGYGLENSASEPDEPVKFWLKLGEPAWPERDGEHDGLGGLSRSKPEPEPEPVVDDPDLDDLDMDF